MTRATKHILAAAKRTANSGVHVDLDRRFPHVTIRCDTEDDIIFMQGDEADAFIAEIDALCKRYPSLYEATAALALAQPYAENTWN